MKRKEKFNILLMTEGQKERDGAEGRVHPFTKSTFAFTFTFGQCENIAADETKRASI